MIPAYYHARTSSEGSDRVRGPDQQTKDMFSYLSPEQRVRPDHPLRAMIRSLGQPGGRQKAASVKLRARADSNGRLQTHRLGHGLHEFIGWNHTDRAIESLSLNEQEDEQSIAASV